MNPFFGSKLQILYIVQARLILVVLSFHATMCHNDGFYGMSHNGIALYLDS